MKFFIAMAKEKNVIPQKEEVKEIYWLKPLDAIRCMTHDSDRKVIQWACKYKENN